MMTYSNSRYYKGISLFIKTAILICSLVYIISKINSSNLTNYFKSDLLNWSFFILALVLVAVNWGIEAYKWKFLIRKVENISFIKAFQSVLSGVTIGIFTPNRVGEFAGRVFYLDYENKIQATLISFIGSIIQLLVTVLLGFIAAIGLGATDLLLKNELIKFLSSPFLIVSIASLTLFFLIVIFLKEKIKKNYRKYIDVLFNYSLKELLDIFGLSFIRYLVFTIQYYLVLKCFNIDLGFYLSIQLIALTFLISSVIPTFAFTEMSVRGASAMYFFGMYIEDTSLVLASSLIVWLINLALPSIIGGLFIWKLKFFKEKN